MAKPFSFLVLALLCAAGLALAQQQVNDPDFSTRVERPAFTTEHPRVGIDEAHHNFHTRDGRYKPFAALMEADGYEVSAAPPFDASSLKSLDILVIANAMGDPERRRGSGLHARGMRRGSGLGARRRIAVAHRRSRSLGEHAILRGRNPAEQVRRIVAFTGQSLSVPANATVLMKISSDATESFDPEDQRKIQAGLPAGKKIEGRAQGIAMAFGSGRVAVFGEAACTGWRP